MDIAKKTILYYWSHLKKLRREFIGTAVLLPLVTLTGNYLAPLVLADVLNKLSKHDFMGHQIWHSFGWDIILYAAIFQFNGLLWRLFDVFYWRLEGKMERLIAQDVFRHLISLSADFHANEFAGSLVSQNNKVMSAYVRIADTTLFQVAPLIYGLIIVSLIMGHRAPIYVGILIFFSLVYMISAVYVTRPVRAAMAEHAASESQQTGFLADALTNVLAIKSFARDHYERSRFASVTDSTYQKLVKMLRAFQIQQFYFNAVAGLLAALSLVAAVISVVIFNANLATAFLIFNYTAGIISQLFTFSNQSLRTYNRSFGDAREMTNVLSLTPEVADPEQPEALRIKSGQIDFKDVFFTHSGSSDAIFKNFNLTIKDGEKVGLVGHSGAGKTTFTRLILRFSDIDKGEILIDGQNIAHITQNDLNSRIAYVPQEPLLFHRTIEENMAYGETQATKAQIKAVAKKAHAQEFIDDLPSGYQTVVGERGVKLSGGQRQRVAIARAMLKDAPVLILDEATSALDSESEVLIQDALWKLMAGRTAIVIAHRLSTVQRMDRILVIDQGEIVEEGTHKQLLAKGGTYAKLWAHQSGGFLED